MSPQQQQLTPQQQKQQEELNQQIAQMSARVEGNFTPIITALQKTVFQIGSQMGQMQVSSRMQTERQNDEIHRLQELLTKNKISFDKKQPTRSKESKIAPPPPSTTHK